MPGIIDGVWSDAHAIDPSQAEDFFNWITSDGSPGPTGRGGFPAEAGRYHLYLSRGCPFSHRVDVALRLLKAEALFSVTYVDDVKRDRGWQITEDVDPVFGADSLHAVMIAAEGKITSKTTVPILVDKQSRRIVSNSSADIVRMMDAIHSENQLGQNLLWPSKWAMQIDDLNGWLNNTISSGPYRVLFAAAEADKVKQSKHVRPAFTKIDTRLGRSRFLHGDEITASDIWLFTPLLRFNSIYSEIFGVDLKLSEFENLSRYLRDLWSIPAFSSSSDLDRIEDHYYLSYIHGPDGPVEPGRGRAVDPASRPDLRPL